MLKKSLAVVLIAGGLAVAAPGTAQAYPETFEEEYCPPWQSHTVYSWRLDRSMTYCQNEIYKAEPILVKRPPTWWNPWTWF